MMRLKRGDCVRVRFNESDEWTEGVVALASETDPSSVMLVFDGAVRDGRGGFILNCLPLTIEYGQERVSSPFGGSYEIEVAA